MSAQPAAGPRRLVAGALSAAAGWLVEPEPVVDERPLHLAPAQTEAGGEVEARGVVAVVALGPRCGATVLARALGAELARRDANGACAVTVGAGGGGRALGHPAAGRLARTLAPIAPGRVRASGRLCLVDCADHPALAGATLYVAPLVLDGCDPFDPRTTAALADDVVIVGGPAVEPALASAVAAALGAPGRRPLVVANRIAGREQAWAERADLVLPETRVGAALALAGREVRGDLGRTVSELADRLGGAG